MSGQLLYKVFKVLAYTAFQVLMVFVAAVVDAATIIIITVIIETATYGLSGRRLTADEQI